MDHGVASLSNGALDLDGSARTAGSAPDIGAYEFAPPAVHTASATSVTTDGATLHGSVNDHGSAGAVQFELGVTESYGLTAAAGHIAGGFTTVTVSNPISGLPSGTTFHYRLDFVVVANV